MYRSIKDSAKNNWNWFLLRTGLRELNGIRTAVFCWYINFLTNKIFLKGIVCICNSVYASHLPLVNKAHVWQGDHSLEEKKKQDNEKWHFLLRDVRTGAWEVKFMQGVSQGNGVGLWLFVWCCPWIILGTEKKVETESAEIWNQPALRGQFLFVLQLHQF